MHRVVTYQCWFTPYMCFNFFQGQKKTKLAGPALRKKKEKDINWEFFLSSKEMNLF